VEHLRDLVVGEEIAAMALKLRFFDHVAEQDKGVNALAKHRAWLGHDRDLDNGGMFEQDVLDLGGIDLIAALSHLARKASLAGLADSLKY
jgi:hypothetical protein